MTDPYRIGWFSTGRDKAARDLLSTVISSIERGEIEAEIAFVFCSRKPGESEQSDLFIKLVEGYRIPLICFSYQRFKNSRDTAPTHTPALPRWRLDYDREVIKRLADFKPDLCVLAGYMLIVSEELCRKYDIINLHPAAPGGPTGTWQEVIRQLIANDARQTGVMMHLVTPELDRGPAVAYCTFPIRGEPFDKYWQEIESLKHDSATKKRAEDSLFKLIR
ncbi:MAG: formyltransferase family protein, partial [Dehalococcoidales bacterium]|nr:formyltransferase family protein [Dehalococcoidales bacterium]